MYCQIGLQTNLSWPVVETEVSWRGQKILLRPATYNYAPDVILEYDETRLSSIAAHKFLREFLSAWVWVEQQRAREFISGTNSTARRVGPGPLFQNISEPFHLEYLPVWNNEKAGLALALYREALNAAGSPHTFLSLWKILSTRNPDQARGPQRDWLLDAFNKIAFGEGKTRLDELRADGKTDEEIALHLFIWGRCAVAHAFTDPIVNPDDPEHEAELQKEIPLIRALAEYAIEHDYAIETENSYLLRNPTSHRRANQKETKVRMFWSPAG